MTGRPCTTSDRAPAEIYLDHAATAPVRPEVLVAMQAAWRHGWANASSVHAAGRRARALVEQARRQVAAWLGVDPARVVFTSGGTEANNLGLLGAAGASSGRRHVVVSAVEHPSVLDAARTLQAQGYALQVVGPDAQGRVPAQAFAAALRPGETAVAALMLANNEVGAVQPVPAVAAAARTAGVPLLVDAVAAAGRLPLQQSASVAALLSVSAHKLGGPQGVGALYVAPGQELAPLLHGGGQERRWRPGTENVAAIAGFGVAAELAAAEQAASANRLRELSRQLTVAVLGAGCGALATGPAEGERVPGLCSFAFPGLDGDSLLVALDLQGVRVGAGAACSSGSLQPSHVLTAMGLPPAACRAPLRFSLGRETTPAEIAAAVAALCRAVERQRAAVGT